MGQIRSLFRNLAQRCRCSSGQQETESITMETVGDSKVTDGALTDVSRIDGDWKLTDYEIERLAREMEARKLESIAIADLGIGIETVNNLKVIRQNDCVAFNRYLLVLWRNMNQGIDQVKVRLSCQNFGDILRNSYL